MVLRAIVAKRREDLKLFRASARLTGFAQQLSLVLRELQRSQLTPDSLNQLAEHAREVTGLAYKLQDLATLLQDYLDWLDAHDLQDADSLLTAATEALLQIPKANGPTLNSEQQGRGPSASQPAIRDSFFECIWVDGFAELSEQEMGLLIALVPYCGAATITFCLDRVPTEKISWLSNWAAVRRTFERCRVRLASLPDIRVVTRPLRREPNQNRFADSPVLQHLERYWAEPQEYVAATFDHGLAEVRSLATPDADVQN